MTEWGDLPLFVAARELRARRRSLRRNRYWLAASGALVATLTFTLAAPPTPRLLWNASASSPIGLYWVAPTALLQRDDRVIAWPPRPVRALAAARHYLPANVPLVKRVAALPGDRICGDRRTVRVNNRVAAVRLRHDARGRPLAAWRGCHTLPTDAFLLLAEAPASFDGRYFGPTDRADVVGKAIPLWLR